MPTYIKKHASARSIGGTTIFKPASCQLTFYTNCQHNADGKKLKEQICYVKYILILYVKLRASCITDCVLSSDWSSGTARLSRVLEVENLLSDSVKYQLLLGKIFSSSENRTFLYGTEQRLIYPVLWIRIRNYLQVRIRIHYYFRIRIRIRIQVISSGSN
jgi:hypothetical protein